MHDVLLGSAFRNTCLYVSFKQEFAKCGPFTYAKWLRGEVTELIKDRKVLTDCGQYASPWMSFRVGAEAIKWLKRLNTEQSIL